MGRAEVRKMTFNAGGNDLLEEQYDEFDGVYGCTYTWMEDLVRCCDCTWESCPMRGGKKEGV
jgi:hypothetical protein